MIEGGGGEQPNRAGPRGFSISTHLTQPHLTSLSLPLLPHLSLFKDASSFPFIWTISRVCPLLDPVFDLFLISSLPRLPLFRRPFFRSDVVRRLPRHSEHDRTTRARQPVSARLCRRETRVSPFALSQAPSRLLFYTHDCSTR